MSLHEEQGSCHNDRSPYVAALDVKEFIVEARTVYNMVTPQHKTVRVSTMLMLQ